MRRVVWWQAWTSVAVLAACTGGPEEVRPDLGPLPDPRGVVENAIDLMGSEDALRAVDLVSFDMMTQWQRADFQGVPPRDRPSFERHQDRRSYAGSAWRNTRDFGTRSVVNIVLDSFATTDFGQGPAPLNAAYLDERSELFTYTPDRLVLALLDATDLTAHPDTLLGLEPHHAISGTLAGKFHGTVFFHAGTGLPTLFRFKAGQPLDFGLVPWGEMEVDVWYSNWTSFGDISIPRQWDIHRAGLPYKRMTVLSADFAAEFSAADSFHVSNEHRESYWASTAAIPMQEGWPLVSPSSPTPGLVVAERAFGYPTAAIQTPDGWFLIGTGQSAFNLKDYIAQVRELGVESIAGVIVLTGEVGQGGVVEAVDQGIPVYVAPAAQPFVTRILANHGRSEDHVTVVDQRTELGSGSNMILLDPLDLPDAPGSLVLFSEALSWLFVPVRGGDLHLRLAETQAQANGWIVERFGTTLNPW